MNTVTYIENQLANIHSLLHDIVGDISEQEWLARAAPGQNRIGFIVWHIPRFQDNIVQTWIRGETEVFHRSQWAHLHHLRPYGVGTGISDAEADEVPTMVGLAETLAYANAVHQELVAWLRQRNDDDLDQVPDAIAHLAPYPEYQIEGFRTQLSALVHLPVWNLLMRPCIGHVHRHLGELQLAKAVLRTHERGR